MLLRANRFTLICVKWFRSFVLMTPRQKYILVDHAICYTNLFPRLSLCLSSKGKCVGYRDSFNHCFGLSVPNTLNYN